MLNPSFLFDRAHLQVKYASEGLAAIIFTAEGDMRQAINNLQSTVSGFEFVSSEAVFKVCDQPHPVVLKQMLTACEKGEIQSALECLDELWLQGYSAIDIIGTLLKVVKGMDRMAEYVKLEFIKVHHLSLALFCVRGLRKLTVMDWSRKLVTPTCASLKVLAQLFRSVSSLPSILLCFHELINFYFGSCVFHY